MQLQPWNLTETESPFFAVQRLFDQLLDGMRSRRPRSRASTVTLTLAPQSTVTLEGGEIELLDDQGMLWVTRECAPDLVLTAGQRVRVPACGRTVVQALSRSRLRIAEAA